MALAVSTLFAAILALGASAAALRWLPHPFAWCAGFGVVFCAFAFAAARRAHLKTVWIHLLAIFAACGLAEAYFAWADTPRGEDRRFRTEGPRVYRADETLGWALPADRSWPSAKYFGDELVYRVTYTTDSHGLRKSGPVRGPGDRCVLFFGGSVTFGEGVGDTETMPFRVGAQSGFHVLNFGVGGYGPHQMLAALESGRVRQVVDCDARFAIYQGINDHVARAAGKRLWMQAGPRYRLDEAGVLRRDGSFGDEHSRPAGVAAQLEKSGIYRRHFRGNPRLTEVDFDRYLAILRKARDELRSAFPELAFHVLHWGTRYRERLEPLRAEGIGVHFVDDVLPGYSENQAAYQLSRHDRHPSARTHALVADYVTREILRGPIRERGAEEGIPSAGREGSTAADSAR